MYLALFVAVCEPVFAQHTDDNAVRSAGDAFGFSIGVETVGLYDSSEVRGFSPATAGNMRIEGLYFDQQVTPSRRVVDGSSIRVGITALQYPFPAPTGIVDYRLRAERANAGVTDALFAGPFETYAATIDGQLPRWVNSLSIPLGVGYRFAAQIPGDTSRVFAIGMAPVWKPTEGVTARAFVDYWNQTDSKTQPRIYMEGSQPPPHLDRRYFGQDWTGTIRRSHVRYPDSGCRALPLAAVSRRVSLGVRQSGAICRPLRRGGAHGLRQTPDIRVSRFRLRLDIG